MTTADDVSKSGDENGLRTFGHVAKRLFWTPKRLRWDPEANHELTWGLTFLYAAASQPVHACFRIYTLTPAPRQPASQSPIYTTATRF